MRRAAGTAVLIASLLLGVLGAPDLARATHVSFGQPGATTVLGQPLVFSTTIEAARQPDRVELLLSLPGDRAVTVLPADVSEGESQGQFAAVATLDGHTPPNTRLVYQFRVRDQEGETLGPSGEALVTDDRFAWRTVEGPVVRLHWYEGDDAFAQRALGIGENAIARASELLGVTETEPVDFFIYDTEPALREALGAGTRENVAGQAHQDIRTLFGLIEPQEIESDWVDTLVTHELTHLVFGTATENPYHGPPRWLNEGVAVYLSEGYTPFWRSTVEAAVRDGSLIPLEGLGGLFPTTAEQFRLAYGESVSAVDYFTRTFDEATLWQLVRSYADGVSDDDAFSAATGADLAAFNAGWMGSLGVDVPAPHGPQPGQPGPVPPGWDDAPAPSPPGPSPSGSSPSEPVSSPATPGSPGAATTTPTAVPGMPENVDGDTGADAVLIGLLLVVAAIAVVGFVGWRRRS